MSSDQKIMDKFVEQTQEILVLKDENRKLKIENDRCKEIAERDGKDYSNLSQKMKHILLICKGNEDFFWSAKIISIILDCDFRDSYKKLNEYVNKFGA